MEAIEGGRHVLMASPEKALCDKVLLTRRVRLTSMAAMRVFLEDDLRLDMDELVGLNLTVIDAYCQGGLKVTALTQLRRVLEGLQ